MSYSEDREAEAKLAKAQAAPLAKCEPALAQGVFAGLKQGYKNFIEYLTGEAAAKRNSPIALDAHGQPIISQLILNQVQAKAFYQAYQEALFEHFSLLDAVANSYIKAKNRHLRLIKDGLTTYRFRPDRAIIEINRRFSQLCEMPLIRNQLLLNDHQILAQQLAFAAMFMLVLTKDMRYLASLGFGSKLGLESKDLAIFINDWDPQFAMRIALFKNLQIFNIRAEQSQPSSHQMALLIEVKAEINQQLITLEAIRAKQISLEQEKKAKARAKAIAARQAIIAASAQNKNGLLVKIKKIFYLKTPSDLIEDPSIIDLNQTNNKSHL